MNDQHRSSMFLRVRLLAIAFLTLLAAALTADEKVQPPRPAIAKSSNLSSALPAGDWARVVSSVDRGLEWLAAQQESDGRFPAEEAFQPAVTSLAVMSFLSRGHVPDQGRYGKQLSKSIDFVLSTQRRRGEFSLLAVEPPASHLSPGQTSTYNHAIAGLMLGEVYGMTSGERSRKIEAAISKALIYHREVQTRKKSNPADIGGWRYGFPDGPEASSDMSVTGWALMFLRSARNAEFNIPMQYYNEGLDFVESCFETDPARHENGVFRYRPAKSEPAAHTSLANTSSALLTLMLGGRQEKDSVTVGVNWLVAHEYPRPWKAPNFYLSTYYSSQALAQAGGDAWNHVFPQIVRSLLDEQAGNGSWPSDAGSERKFGTVYTTSLAVLSLTPPYQLLPIYQR